MHRRRLLLLVFLLVLTTACAGGAQPAPPRDPDIVLAVMTTGGGGQPPPPIPDFEMRADGTVFVPGDGPLGVDRYQLDAEGIRLVRELAASIPMRPDAYGELDWTDLGHTDIYRNLDGEPVGVTVAGLRDVTAPEELDRDLRRGQTRARLSLLETLERLDGLGDPATGGELVVAPRTAYTPDVVEVTLQPAVSWSGDPLTEVPGATVQTPAGMPVVDWPLDRPLSDLPLQWRGGRLCAVVRGAAARAVIDLVEEPGLQPVLWSTGNGTAAPDGDGAGDRAGDPTDAPTDDSSAAPTDRATDTAPDVVQAEVHALLPGDPGGCMPGVAPEHLEIGPFHHVVLAEPGTWDGGFPADRFVAATPLEVYAAAPILAAGAIDDQPNAGSAPPTGPDLTWYTYRVVGAEADDARYLDIEAEEWPDASGDRPAWRARVDLAAGRITDVEVDTLP